MIVTLRKLHRWIGLSLALPLALQGLTGFCMVVLPEDVPGRPHLATAGPLLPALSAEAQILAARAAAPNDFALLRYAPAQQPGEPASVGFGPQGSHHPAIEILLNPASGQIVGTQHLSALYSFMHRLHTTLLLLPTELAPTGWLGVFLFAMVLSGIILWWPRADLWQSGKWKRNLTVSRKARGYRLLREAHLALGGWLFLLLGFMAASGVAICYPDMIEALTWRAIPAPHHLQAGVGTGPADHRPVENGLDTALVRVRQALPEGRVFDAQLAPIPAPFIIRVMLPGYDANRLMNVSVAHDGEEIKILSDPRSQSVGQKLYVWGRVLHQNRLASWGRIGEIWSIVLGAVGISLSFFTISGACMWIQRRVRK